MLRYSESGARYGWKPGDRWGSELVSEADIAVDTTLRKSLLGSFGDDGWLSEEHPDDRERLGHERVWIVDPLDGTREFLQGVPEYAVSIGLSVGGEAVAGVVFNPAKDELYAAALGGEEGELALDDTPSLAEGYMLAGRGEWRFGDLPPVPNGTQLLPVGSIAYRMALLASGTGSLIFTVGRRKEWDVAAGAALLAAAGAQVTDVDGEALRFNRRDPAVRGLIAARPAIHAEAREMWREIRLAAGVRRALVIAVLALLAAAMVGCGDGRPIGEAPSGQLRAAIGPHQDGGLRVALEALDYEGELSRRWYPARDRIEAVAGAGWWRSSSVEILIPAALAISVKDGQFVLEPLVEGFEDPCGLLSLRWSETAPSTPLQVGVVRDEACGIWSAPLSVSLPKEQLQLEAEIAVRLVGDCAEARIHVRRHGRQWRALPSGMVCGLDDLRTRPALTGASATWRSLASPVSAPYYEAPDVIEVRAGPLGLGVAIDGRVLDNVCGGIILQRGVSDDLATSIRRQGL